MRRVFVSLVTLAALLTAGAGASLADDTLMNQGREVYETYCQSCHEGAVKKAPHFSMLQLMLPGTIERALSSGVMQEQAADLSDRERQAVAAYLSGNANAAVRATPPVCDAGIDWFDATALPDAKGWGITPENTRYISEDIAGMTAEDLPHLTLKWVFAYPGALRARSQPVTAAGALFVGSHDGTVYALDQETGCVHWTFQASAEVRTSLAVQPWVTPAGVPQRGLLFFGDLVGNIYAVDIRTGEQVWREKPSDHHNATITATPAYFDGRLYVAVSSLEVTSAADPAYECCTFRGMLKAYDADTGQLVWSAETIDEPIRETGTNSAGTLQYGPSGAPIWAGIALDPKRNRIYVGTGENYSTPATDTSDAILAYDMTTGDRLWRFQATANDVWNMGCEVDNKANCPPEKGPDFDFGAAPLVATASDGQDIVLAGQKSGDVYALSPETGELLWTRRVGRGGIQGGIHFGMSVVGDTLFVPVSDFDDGHDYGKSARPGMHALDIRTGELQWSTVTKNVCEGKQYCEPGISAAAMSIPGAVLGGAMDGRLRAYDVQTGEIIWSYNTDVTFDALGGIRGRGGSFGGAAGPVFKDGMMYVNSGYGIYFHMPGNVLLAFELKK